MNTIWTRKIIIALVMCGLFIKQTIAQAQFGQCPTIGIK